MNLHEISERDGNNYIYARNFQQMFPEAVLPADLDVLYERQISDWSWGALLIIYKSQNKHYIMTNFDKWEPEEVTEEQAIQEVLDFEECLQNPPDSFIV